MTLGELREVTKDMPDTANIIVNYELLENLNVYSADTDPEDNTVIIMASWEEE